MLLNFRVGESAAGADGAVVDQRAAFDDFCPVVDGYPRILEHSLGIVVSNTQFGNLAGAPRGGILVALAAGLCVVQRSEPIGEGLNFFEFRLIGGVRGSVDQSITLVVEAGWERPRAPVRTREALMTRKEKYR